MAKKLYSSIREEDIKEIERDVKSVFSVMAKGNPTMCKQILDHTKLVMRRDNLSLKIRNSLTADESTLARWKADLDILNEKWNALFKSRDARYIHTIVKFSIFVEQNGLHLLTEQFHFYLWLHTDSKNTKYYDYRR